MIDIGTRQISAMEIRSVNIISIRTEKKQRINDVDYSRGISLCIHVFMIIVPSLPAQKKERTRGP